MPLPMKPTLAALLLIACAGGAILGAPTAGAANPARDAALMALAADYLATFYFPEGPTTATAEGVHKYADRLEDYTQAGTERQIKALHGYLARLEAFDP